MLARRNLQPLAYKRSLRRHTINYQPARHRSFHEGNINVTFSRRGMDRSPASDRLAVHVDRAVEHGYSCARPTSARAQPQEHTSEPQAPHQSSRLLLLPPTTTTPSTNS